MGKKRKKSTAHRVPPLTKTDRALYITVMLLSAPLFLGVLIGWDLLQRRIAFRDPAVIACKASTLAVMPFLWFLAGVLIFFVCCFAAKKPLLGDKTLCYGGYPWKYRQYPMFGSQRWAKHLRPTQRRIRTAVIVVLAVLLAVSLFSAIHGLYKRTCLREDRTIVEYDSLNQPGDSISIARDCDSITVCAYKENHPGHLPTWEYGVKLHCEDGRLFEFNAVDFNLLRDGQTNCLQQLLAIKALFSPDQITIERADLLPKVIKNFHLDKTQAALLEALFAPPK